MSASTLLHARRPRIHHTRRENDLLRKRALASSSLWPRCGGVNLEKALQRMRPNVVHLGDRSVNHRAPLKFDAQRIATDDLTELLRRHSILSRSLEKRSKESWCDGHDGTSASFAKNGAFRRSVVIQADLGPERGRARSCPGNAGETRFRNRDCQTTVANVVRRPSNGAASQRDETD